MVSANESRAEQRERVLEAIIDKSETCFLFHFVTDTQHVRVYAQHMRELADLLDQYADLSPAPEDN